MNPEYVALETGETFENEYLRKSREQVENYNKTTDTQIGGNHYQLPIQPIDYIVKNDIPYREANIIKYVTRYKNKNGVEDLKKARHYLDMLIESYDD